MIHLGDITKISGYTAPPVDCVIGGSPCQDLSIAGKRAGLAGARSGLFMDQIRLIKELRNADIQRGRTGQFIRPRFMLWENVPGAFSSNGGEDFRAVLEETIRIAEPDAPDIPLPPKGRWPLADAWIGDGWSVAYRVFDAQFWGVPQRRRRIALVADFGGHAAPEILFIRKSVSRDFGEGGAPGETAPGGTGGGAYPTIERALTARYDGSPCLDRGPNIVVQTAAQTLESITNRGLYCGEVTETLRAQSHGALPIVAGFKHKAGAKAGNIGFEVERAPTLSAEQTTAVIDCRELAATQQEPLVMATARANAEILKGVSPTILSGNERLIIAFTERGREGGRNCETLENVMYALTNPGAGGRTNSRQICDGSVCRRLTPLECERLQGYPDGWTNIGPWTDSKGKRRECTDAARYKALGNSIALPPWAWVLKRLCACYERAATMASLFDGIGGFPLLRERLNGPGSCLWASEIEEFPIAVTKHHFGKEIAIP